MNRHRGKLRRPVHPDAEKSAGQIADYVWTEPRYQTHQKIEVSCGGDAWLIASAKHDKGTVVSNESNRFPNSKKVRIPDVCDVFGVKCRTMIQLIKEIPGRILENHGKCERTALDTPLSPADNPVTSANLPADPPSSAQMKFHRSVALSCSRHLGSICSGAKYAKIQAIRPNFGRQTMRHRIPRGL